MAARRARRRRRLGLGVHRLRRRRHLPVRVPDRPPLRLRAAAARGRAGDRLPARGALRGRARHDLDRRAGLRQTPGRVARRAAARPARRRLRARPRDDRPRLPRARAGGRSSSPGTAASTTPAPSSREFELESVRESVRINTEGFWRFLEAFAPGRSEREVLAPCEAYFVSQGCGRLTMDMVLVGENGAALPEFKVAGARRFGRPTWCCPRSRSPARAATGSRSRARSARASRAPRRRQMLEAYEEYFDAARERAPRRARPPTTCTARSRSGFLERGFQLGHVTGHSIGMTMIEFPKIGEGDETELARGDGLLDASARDLERTASACLYMQDTWLVTAEGGVPLAADCRWRSSTGAETRRERAASSPSRCCRARAAPTTSATCAPTRCSPCRRGPRSGLTATSCSSRPCTRPRSSGSSSRPSRRPRQPPRSPPASSAAPNRLLRRGIDCLKIVTARARHARAPLALGVPGGAQGARARQRLRLARLPRRPEGDARRSAPPSTRRSRGPGCRCVELYVHGARARGALPARRAPDRVGRAGRRLARPPLRRRRADHRRRGDRHAGDAGRGARAS